jgi:hypothetical protein
MKKSLAETNPYLKDPKLYNEALDINVRSSSAIEGARLRRNDQKKDVKKGESDRKP